MALSQKVFPNAGINYKMNDFKSVTNYSASNSESYDKLNMSEIKTLVYFEIEASGLKNSGRQRIAKVSLVAVNSKDVLELHSKIMNPFKEGKYEAVSLLPRSLRLLILIENYFVKEIF